MMPIPLSGQTSYAGLLQYYYKTTFMIPRFHGQQWPIIFYEMHVIEKVSCYRSRLLTLFHCLMKTAFDVSIIV